MRNLLFLLFASLPFCFPSLYANIPTQSPTPAFCLPGFRRDVRHEDYCVPCQSGTYNHGQMPWGRTKCYPILQREIVLVNSTAVKCSKYWAGAPIYADGEYQYGCYDDGEEHTPTAAPSVDIEHSGPPALCGSCPFRPTPYPTKWPSRKSTKYPTRFPSPYPTQKPIPTAIPTQHPTQVPTQVPTAHPTKVPTRHPTKAPTPHPTKAPTPHPTKVPTIPPVPVPPHHNTVIIHHHGDNDSGHDHDDDHDHDDHDDDHASTNAYDIGIAALVILALLLIIGGILCYKKKMKKYRLRRIVQGERDRSFSSQIELPAYQPDPYAQAGAVTGRPLPKRAVPCDTYPIGRTITDNENIKKASI